MMLLKNVANEVASLHHCTRLICEKLTKKVSLASDPSSFLLANDLVVFGL